MTQTPPAFRPFRAAIEAIGYKTDDPKDESKVAEADTEAT